MLLTSLFISLLSFALASPVAEVEKRQVGPSGQVITPGGGAVYEAYYGVPSARIHLVYRPVKQYNPPSCTSFSCLSRTYFISASLTNSTHSYPLASYLASPYNGNNIDAWFVPPANVCGNFRLVVRESALYQGQRVEFQSAAPAVSIRCRNAPTTRSLDDATVGHEALAKRDFGDNTLVARQDPGPSGRVIQPAGGTQIVTDRGYASAAIRFVYSTVYQRVVGNCSYCTAETLYVEVSLVPVNGGEAFTLATFLSSAARGQNIDTYLGAPAAACSDYRLVIREYQLLRGELISFQSAAPAIYLNCVRLP